MITWGQTKSAVGQLVVFMLPFGALVGPNGLPAFDRPPSFILAALALLLIVRTTSHNKVLRPGHPIPAVLCGYGLLMLVIVCAHRLLNGVAAWPILYLYLSFIAYLFVFFGVFYKDPDSLSKLASLFVRSVILLQALFAIFEFEMVARGFVSVENFIAYGDNIQQLKNSIIDVGSPYHLLFKYRPGALFLSATHNALIPLIAFFGLMYLDRQRDLGATMAALYRRRFPLLVLVLVNVVYSGSNTALIVTPAMLLLSTFVYGGQEVRKIVLVLTLASTVLYYASLELSSVERFSMDYFQYVINDSIKMFQAYAAQDGLSRWIGYDHVMNGGRIHSNLLFLLSMTGAMGLLAYLMVNTALLLLLRNTELRLFLCAIVLSSLHYPVSANQFVHALTALLLAHYLLLSGASVGVDGEGPFASGGRARNA